MRSECKFYHPAIRNVQGFHWGHPMEPPIMKSPEILTSTKKIPIRIPVIVMNQTKMNKNLSQNLEDLVLGYEKK